MSRDYDVAKINALLISPVTGDSFSLLDVYIVLLSDDIPVISAIIFDTINYYRMAQEDPD